MELCLVTNYNGGYINESIILKTLQRTLNISEGDIFFVSDVNSVYKINEKYTHTLIFLDYKLTTLYSIKQYLKELQTIKVFIADTVPELHKELDKEFCNNLLKSKNHNLTCIPAEHFTYLYEEFADGIVTYSKRDIEFLQEFYKFNKQIPITVIPPSLGKTRNDIQLNFTKLSKNTNIGFNGSPSYANGLLDLYLALPQLTQYSVNLYGTHGRNDLSNQTLTNFLTENNKNIKFRGKLKNYVDFYKNHHIYYGNSKYASFDYNTFTSLLNGVIPIIGINSTTAEYLPQYPFITNNTPESLVEKIKLIESLNNNQINEILETNLIYLKELNDVNLKELYNTFLKQLLNG